MFEFIIVDDNKEFNSELYKLINAFQIQNRLLYNIKRFFEYNEELHQVINSNNTYKIFILDIELPSINGIEIAKRIRKLDHESLIIIITAHTDTYIEQIISERIMYLDFVHKQANWREQIISILQDLMCNKNHKHIMILETKDINIRLQINSILYISYNDRKSTIYTTTNYFTVSRSLNELMEQLDDRFMYCYKSIIVNVDYIHIIDKRERIIYLFNNVKISNVSAMYLKKINECIKKETL